jgi:hypothetical protein
MAGQQHGVSETCYFMVSSFVHFPFEKLIVSKEQGNEGLRQDEQKWVT